MSGRAVHKIMEQIFDILKKEGTLSIRQLSIKTGSQWMTVQKALQSLQKLEVVKEIDSKEKRKVRLFKLKK